jgi:hypothetical protein
MGVALGLGEGARMARVCRAGFRVTTADREAQGLPGLRLKNEVNLLAERSADRYLFLGR